jgi:hypothetical protein
VDIISIYTATVAVFGYTKAQEKIKDQQQRGYINIAALANKAWHRIEKQNFLQLVDSTGQPPSWQWKNIFSQSDLSPTSAIWSV